MKKTRALKILNSWNGGLFVEKREHGVSYGYLDSEITEAIKVAVRVLKIPKKKPSKWKLVKRGPFIDIVCADCGYVKFTGYAYNRKPDEVLTYLKTKDTDRLPAYCEGCGAQMKGVTK